MTDFVEPFESIHDALKTRFTAEGVTAFDYHPVALRDPNGVYMQVADVLADVSRADQGELEIGQVQYKLRYYARLDKDPREAHRDAYAFLHKAYAVFADASLGGAVRDARLDRASIDPVQLNMSDRPMLMVELDATIRPRHYAVSP